MKTVFTFGGENPFKAAKYPDMITVVQRESGKKLFDVVYGLEVKKNPTYAEACAETGQAVLHHQCCEGIAYNDGA